ncbi:MAG: BON domain-containing protein [Candidatus Pacebacteria bacterium]|nr:BON domain-containing protein [Candidatus Paceibacterota bacterium]
MATDEQIKQKVTDEIFWDARIDDSKINIDVENGVVKLTGEVPTCSDLFNAEDDVWSIPEVSGVDNRLIVVLEETPIDTEILNNAESVLAWNPYIDGSKITVDVDGGLVTLTGSVDAYWKKIRAENLIFDLRGVTGVSNKLSVVPTRDFDDEQIANNIVSAIDRNVYVDAESVNVEVENGIVTLSGMVPTFAAYKAAYNAASYTLGVIDVIDNLTVGGT